MKNLKKYALSLAKWANETTEGKINISDTKKLVVELIIKDKNIFETIEIFNHLEQEIKEYLERTAEDNRAEVLEIENFFNPIPKGQKTFKDRTEEIKEKYNYKFDKN